ncbi:MAG: hypothetical protein C0490_01400 [Marivirga sp.]|jgi:hypothetical protein|nr:hypothetical protein [Marivirga sp.]
MKITLLLIFLIGIFMEKANPEPMFQIPSPSVIFIDGNAMRALKIAYDDFLKSGKDVREFTIIISEKTEENKNGSNEIFSVMFMGKLSPGKRGLGTANRVPGSATYFISKEEWKIIKEQGIR